MKVIRDDTYFSVVFGKHFQAVFKVFGGIHRGIFEQNPVLRNTGVNQVAGHSVRFRKRFVRTLPAGDNAFCIRVRFQVFGRFVKPVLQYQARPVLKDLRAEYNQPVYVLVLIAKMRQNQHFRKKQKHATDQKQGKSRVSHRRRQFLPKPEDT